jgi:predicted RNA binding protein YcfA (HicA-like mRNA interferase family)
MNFRELEKLILAAGWQYKNCVGSHYQYVHPVKSGKVTIPNHVGDIPRAVVQSVLKQAGLKSNIR